MLVFGVCGVRENLYVFSLYCNPDLDDRIFDCILTATAAVQAEDVHASFLFVGDLNGHHQECWVLQPQIVLVLEPLTSQLCLVAVSWLLRFLRKVFLNLQVNWNAICGAMQDRPCAQQG